MTRDEWNATDELLASAWNLDNLQVYGDHLQERNDPRGELVAIDLHLAREGSSPELLHRKRNRIRAWLGLDQQVDPTRGAWSQVEFGYGFVIDVRGEQLSRVLESPGAPFIRGVTLTGKTALIERNLLDLSKAPRPWLSRLTIAPRFRGQSPGLWVNKHPPNLANTSIPKLIAATPRLEELRLSGHCLLREFPHPNVQRLVIGGINALQSILLESEPMPRVRELVLAFAHEWHAPITALRPLPPMISPVGFPALRRLDVSPNEELRAITDTQIDIFEAMSRFEVIPELEELRVPSVRTQNEAIQLQRALDRVPKLRRLEIARVAIVQSSTRAERVIDELPWPRFELAQGELELRFRGARTPNRIPISNGVRICEIHYRDWTADQRAAWSELWQRALRDAQPQTMAARTLNVALDALGYIDANLPGNKPWWLLREMAREANPDDEVGIGRRPAPR